MEVFSVLRQARERNRNEIFERFEIFKCKCIAEPGKNERGVITRKRKTM